MYADYMELFSRIFNVLGELAPLARTLFTAGMHFLALCARSRSALAAENLFLRKQLAFYQERKVAPRRFDIARAVRSEDAHTPATNHDSRVRGGPYGPPLP